MRLSCPSLSVAAYRRATVHHRLALGDLRGTHRLAAAFGARVADVIIVEHPTARTYFNVSRDHSGEVFLHIQHRVGEYVELLLVPIAPHNAVEAMAPHLDPAFAHYVRQWQRFIPKGDEPGSVYFYVPTRLLPAHIAPESERHAIADILWEHSSDKYKSWWADQRPLGLAIWPTGNLGDGNVDDVAVSAKDLGIDLHTSK